MRDVAFDFSCIVFLNDTQCLNICRMNIRILTSRLTDRICALTIMSRLVPYLAVTDYAHYVVSAKLLSIHGRSADNCIHSAPAVLLADGFPIRVGRNTERVFTPERKANEHLLPNIYQKLPRFKIRTHFNRRGK